MLNGKLEHLGYDGRGVDEECDLLNDLIITEVSVMGGGKRSPSSFLSEFSTSILEGYDGRGG